MLGQYELVVEETLLAGRVQEAFDLYWFGIGNHRNLAWVLGDVGRGLRILERFVPQDNFSRIASQLSLPDRFSLVSSFGLFAYCIGDLPRSRRALLHCQELGALDPDLNKESIVVRNLAWLELQAGRFREALAYSDSVAMGAMKDTETGYFVTRPATSNFACDDLLPAIAASLSDFKRATELDDAGPLYSSRGAYEAERHFLRGDTADALRQTKINREIAFRNELKYDICRCDALLARLLICDDPAHASQSLQDARTFASASGVVELQLCCFQAAGELQRHLGDFTKGIEEAEAGVLLADTCGFGKYSIDLRLMLAETLLAAGEGDKALKHARNALDRSQQEECEYAWGKADGLHICGLAFRRLGDRELARVCLSASLELREHLGHGRVEETRRLCLS
jgi:tetratricopeptide (TPR) repeat protein